jgi:hypothetical protein
MNENDQSLAASVGATSETEMRGGSWRQPDADTLQSAWEFAHRQIAERR